MDLMDEYRNRIRDNEDVSHGDFRKTVFIIQTSNKDGNYHFCEEIALAFKERNRWEEVFENLYGDMPKYSD